MYIYEEYMQVYNHHCKRYCGWASEIRHTTNLGWLKPQQNNGINHRFQLVQDFAGPSTLGS